MRNAWIIAFVGLMGPMLGACGAAAQASWSGSGLGPRVSARGLIAAGGQEGGAGLGRSSGAFLFGDFEMALKLGRSGRVELGLGALGVVGRRHETYATLSWRDVRGGLWSAGLPRPAYDSVAPGAVLHVLPHLAVDTVGLTHSRATFGAMTLTRYLPVGLSWRHEAPGLKRAVSLHYWPGGDELVIGAAIGLNRGRWRFEAAVEHVSQGASGVNAKLRAVYSGGSAEWSLAWFHAPANGRDGMAELAVAWDLGERVRLSGFHDHALGTGAPDRTGIAAEVGLGGGYAASMAVVRNGGTDVVGAWLGRRF